MIAILAGLAVTQLNPQARAGREHHGCRQSAGR
jgi:hypothetical protein